MKNGIYWKKITRVSKKATRDSRWTINRILSISCCEVERKCTARKLSPSPQQGSLLPKFFLSSLLKDGVLRDKLIRNSKPQSLAARQAWHRSTDSLETMSLCRLMRDLCVPVWKWARFYVSCVCTSLQLRQPEIWQSFRFAEALPYSSCLLLSHLKLDMQKKPQMRNLLFIKLCM